MFSEKNKQGQLQKFIEQLLEQDVLLSPDFLDGEKDGSFEALRKNLPEMRKKDHFLVITKDHEKAVAHGPVPDWLLLDKLRVDFEKERNSSAYGAYTQQHLSEKLAALPTSTSSVASSLSLSSSAGEISSSYHPALTAPPTILIPSAVALSLPSAGAADFRPILASAPGITLSYENVPKKYTPSHFTALFLSRYRFLESVLRGHHELRAVMSISRFLEKRDKERTSLIAIVMEIKETKKGHVLLTIEDPTGTATVLVPRENAALLSKAKEIVHDEVLGFVGVHQKDFFLCDDILWPDVPLQSDLKKGEQDQSVVFLSDIHVGSKLFLEKEFRRFLQWLRGEFGTPEQRELSKSVAYVIIAGDVVDGIGVYPSQEEELAITDIREQYRLFAQLLMEIPSNKQIVICPGNHDMVHLAEPQPVFYKNIAPDLHQLPHITLVTNPAIVTLGKTATFPGFDVLLYHGYSFDYYVAQVEALRNRGGYRRADLIMQFLLKRRHLAPTFGSTPYFPGHAEDPLLIKKIPDFFVSGHIHYSCVANYRSITLISGSCWQGKTSFQEKLGHEPEPGRVPVINLKTREVKVLRFV